MRQVTDMTVDRRGVRPVGFHCDDGKAAMLDQVACDGGAGAIEIGCAVTRFTEQDNTPVGEAVE